MRKEARAVPKVKLSKISSQSFEHEADRKALEALRKTVGFDRLIKALASITTDKLFGVITNSSFVKIGPKQVPTLWRLYTDVCDTLDMEQGTISERLQAIYIFCKRCLMEARRERDAGKIRVVVRLLGDLREAWAQVAGAGVPA